jgi:hypothetical protein
MQWKGLSGFPPKINSASWISTSEENCSMNLSDSLPRRPWRQMYWTQSADQRMHKPRWGTNTSTVLLVVVPILGYESTWVWWVRRRAEEKRIRHKKSPRLHVWGKTRRKG